MVDSSCLGKRAELERKSHKHFQLVRSALPLALARTLELDNGSQILFFAESFEGNSAKKWVQVGRIVQKWVQIGYNFEM